MCLSFIYSGGVLMKKRIGNPCIDKKEKESKRESVMQNGNI